MATLREQGEAASVPHVVEQPSKRSASGRNLGRSCGHTTTFT
ncbi:hypothetical protein [Paenibacillus pabuli]